MFFNGHPARRHRILLGWVLAEGGDTQGGGEVVARAASMPRPWNEDALRWPFEAPAWKLARGGE